MQTKLNRMEVCQNCGPHFGVLINRNSMIYGVDRVGSNEFSIVKLPFTPPSAAWTEKESVDEVQ